MDAITSVFGRLYGELFAWLSAHGVAAAGAPWARYLTVGREEFEMELASPVAAAVTGDAVAIAGVLPACEVARTVHVGPYASVVNAYRAISSWLAANGGQQAGAPWEVYLTDPVREPDPSKWQTLVYVPIARTAK
jgi:effector-binding domain-containing protein